MNKLWFIKFNAINLLRVVPRHIFSGLHQTNQSIHILFCLVDHFEPGTGGASFITEKKRMQKLLSKYPLLAEKHQDNFGHPPKRTWFFPPHYHRNCNLKELVSLCRDGYGEIELHLHHGKIKPDTADNLKNTIDQCIKEYSEFGIFGTENGKKRYGFIHGNSALDNSRGGKFCGVNNEIQVLIETGCYADFTFPCACEANPSKINSVYYAINDPLKPKSYNRGFEVVINGNSEGNGLMIIQGPLFPYFKKKGLLGLRLYTPVIDGQPPVDRKRINAWIRSNIHIKGAKNWIIIKTHTHGAVESKAVLEDEIDFIFEYLENCIVKDKEIYLHYVSARELYNIIKAIEGGKPLTNPEEYRNFKIKPPCYDSSPKISEASKYLQYLIGKTYS